MNLSYESKSAWENLTDTELKELYTLSDSYVNFLDKGKTERECTRQIIAAAKEKGFKALDEVIKSGQAKKGTKIFLNNKDKSVVLMVLGNKLTDGMNVVGTHIDSPRLDLKQQPLYEDSNIAYLKTHYYGGVKKYHWAAIPLALHGVIYTKEGKKIDVCIGEDEKDPVFFINDLLIHLSRKQLQEKLSEGITGEQLNIVIGNQKPAKENDDKKKDKKEKKDPVKENILKILYDQYGITEEDFRVAEIEVVPAGKARDVGFDRSLIAGHGHDDRICAYTALRAILEVEKPERTAVVLFADKEEIGSVGNTGMGAVYFENMVAEVLALDPHSRSVDVRRAMARSSVLSADVSGGFEPNFSSVFEKRNSGYIGNGVCINKYTGSGGKFGSNDANVEFLQEVRTLFADNNVVWQTAELGKIDAGGGGTIAFLLAKYGAEVVDCGPAVLSMHAPYELASKADLYMAYRAYAGFLKR